MNLSKCHLRLLFDIIWKKDYSSFSLKQPFTYLQTAMTTCSLGQTAKNVLVFRRLWFLDSQLFLLISCQVSLLGPWCFWSLLPRSVRASVWHLQQPLNTAGSQHMLPFCSDTSVHSPFPTSMILLSHNSLWFTDTSFSDKPTPPNFLFFTYFCALTYSYLKKNKNQTTPATELLKFDRTIWNSMPFAALPIQCHLQI